MSEENIEAIVDEFYANIDSQIAELTEELEKITRQPGWEDDPELHYDVYQIEQEIVRLNSY